jgi:phospholipid/cholesterol/gamma-HCH transport system substrate-binding protein
MRVERRVVIQLIVFALVAVVAGAVITIKYIELPNLLFGTGHYQVTMQLPATGGLYKSGNVTYRGTEVGRVKSVDLTRGGVQAVLSLDSDIAIPSDVEAQVHSQSAIGEQYVALLPRSAGSPPLKDGDVIPRDRTSIPPDINTLLDDVNRGLKAIPEDNLKTVVDESYLAFGGLGPELSRIVRGSTRLASDARTNLGDLTNLIDHSAPVLNTQTDTRDSIEAWADHLANVTQQLKTKDSDVAGILREGAPATDAGRALFERLQPTLPILLANLTSVGGVAVTYRAGIEQLLVLLPEAISIAQAITVADKDLKTPYRGAYLSFNLNLNIPPVCTTGFLPVQQQRPQNFQDSPDRPSDNLYCRVPQDSVTNVRGARNIPCVTRPGKRAATVKMCESDENYVPLNDGYNWKGDPNATSTGQPIPEPPPGAHPPAPASPPQPPKPLPPIATAYYDPATGSYIGPDGHRYTQSDLAGQDHSHNWQSMLLPPGGN